MCSSGSLGTRCGGLDRPIVGGDIRRCRNVLPVFETDIEIIGGALSDLPEYGRSRLAAVVALLWFVERDGDAQFGSIGREKADERGKVLSGQVALRPAGFLSGAGLTRRTTVRS
jgi:hypothetical protein